jgi:GntR family transcriptional regulator / MocR family aminotransferase
MLSETLLTNMAALQAQGRLPLNRQLYEALKRALLDGRLSAGERLPSSRELATDLRLARNTVVAAIGQLTLEGHLSSRVGSGTYVSDHFPRAPRRAESMGPITAGRLSTRGHALAHTHRAQDREVQPFTPGIPDFGAFPIALWQRLQNRHWRMAYPDMLDYCDNGGHAPLRRAVAQHLRVLRSVQLDADDVIITTGTQQSLELCARLLADAGDTAWIEDPAYWGAVKAFMAAGLALQPVAVDDQGLDPAQASGPPPRLIYVTPSHHYPSGAVMTLARRHLLLGAAREHGAWILEDDYDSEFRLSGQPVSSLAGLDTDGRVLYMGSFSKVLYPGLKLGYLVVPRSLRDAFRSAHYDLNRPGQLPLQAALAEFIDMGHFSTALRRARQTYALRRNALIAALAPCLSPLPQRGPQQQQQLQPDGIYISGAEQGIHLCLRLPGAVDDQALAARASSHGMTVRPLSAYCLHRRDCSGLVIGYGYAPLRDIAHHGPVLAGLIAQAIVTPPCPSSGATACPAPTPACAAADRPGSGGG